MRAPNSPGTTMPPGHDQPPPTISSTPCLLDIVQLLAEVLAAARDTVARCERAIAFVIEARSVEGHGLERAVSLPNDTVRSRALPTHNGHSNGSVAPAIARAEVRDASHCALTPREMEVVHLIAAGLSNKEIASALGVSVRTIEHHITHVYRKIGARGKADATAWAVRQQLVCSNCRAYEVSATHMGDLPDRQPPVSPLR